MLLALRMQPRELEHLEEGGEGAPDLGTSCDVHSILQFWFWHPTSDIALSFANCSTLPVSDRLPKEQKRQTHDDGVERRKVKIQWRRGDRKEEWGIKGKRFGRFMDRGSPIMVAGSPSTRAMQHSNSGDSWCHYLNSIHATPRSWLPVLTYLFIITRC